jgi:hypothetical protein
MHILKILHLKTIKEAQITSIQKKKQVEHQHIVTVPCSVSIKSLSALPALFED